MNDKVKSLFFSQYLGQKVYKPKVISELTLGHISGMNRIACLELRDIENLTDAEKKVIAKFSYFGDSIPLSNVDDLFAHYLNRASVVSGESWWVIQDYLRSIGILISFTYLSETNQPITLTPAEIINLGWAKLKEDEQ